MKFKKIYPLCILLFLFVGCTDYLDRPDLDSITTDNFWKTSNDLQLYVNRYYTSFPGWSANAWNGGIYWHDDNSDNMIRPAANSWLSGNNAITTSNSSWNFSNIRNMNIFMANYENVEDDFDNYKQYVGEALFFRAYYNFNLLRNYGPYPYTNEVLTVDSESLYGERTPRNTIVQNIIGDLDEAASYMVSGSNSNGNRLNKEVAQLFKARIALYEGTWEKYHNGTPYGVSGSDGSSFLAIAEQAAETVMNSGHYSIHSTGNPNEDYWSIFNQSDYGGHSEVMLWRRFDVGLGLAHNGQRYLASIGGGRGITKSLVDDYLCIDGQPIATSTFYQGDDDLIKVTTDRDPRLAQTIYVPGQPFTTENGVVTEEFDKPDLDKTGEAICPTGYQIRKGSNPDIDQKYTSRVGTTSSPIFRYAEALLIFAEAKAELGTITQADIDKSINELRARAGMPDLVMGSITTDPNWSFPSLSPIINEIRRERRVEYAAEGYRLDDMKRWAAFDELILNKRSLGMKFNPADFPGLTPFLDPNGYVDAHQNELPSGYQVQLDRDYLLPVPPDEIVINPELTQNPGW